MPARPGCDGPEGEGDMEGFDTYASPLGTILLRSNGGALTGLWFEGQKNAPRVRDDEPGSGAAALCGAVRWLDIYFSGREPDFTPPVRLTGTPFRLRVWEALLEVPYGKVATYADLARMAGYPRAYARAVGSAVGMNPVSIVVPCHRILGSNGSLTGYAGGTDRKLRLLRLEGVSLPELSPLP